MLTLQALMQEVPEAVADMEAVVPVVEHQEALAAEVVAQDEFIQRQHIIIE